MFTVPVIGPVMVLGHLAALVFTALSGAVDGAVLTGGLGALGAALFSIGIPHHSVLQYEQALKADAYLVVAHGPVAEIAQAKTVLQSVGPTQLDMHAEPMKRANIAA